MKDILKERKSEWKRRIQEIVCLFFILQGMCLCMESILGIAVPARFRFLSGLALIFASELLVRSWRLLAGTAAFVCGLLFLYIKNQEMLQTAAKEMANRILELINRYQGTDFLYWHLQESSQSMAWFMLLTAFSVLGAVECILLIKSKDSAWHLCYLLALPTLIIAAGLAVGRSVSFVGMLLLVSGVLAEMLDIRQKGFLVLAAGISIGVGFSAWISGNQNLLAQIEIWHGDWQKKQLAVEDRMLELLDRAWDNSFLHREKKAYALTNEKPATTGKKVFEITVDAPVSQSFYVRGFVGGDYEDGSWKRVSRQEFSDWAQRQGGSEQEYSRIIQSLSYEFLSSWSEVFDTPLGNKIKVSMTVAGGGQDFTLMPYFTQVPESQPVKADGTFPPVNGREFSWDSYLNLSEFQALAVEMEEMEEIFRDERKAKNGEIWAKYGEYVQENYTRLPKEGLQSMRDYAGQRREQNDIAQIQVLTDSAEGRGYWASMEQKQKFLSVSARRRTIQAVRQMLWENSRYSFDLQPLPEGEDYAEYFLFTQQKGYCVHFATAATLLLRMKGLPARFVTGYLVLPSDFKKNKDGTWTAEITDERAHAWTEVFARNIGFYPVEVTPPSYVELLQEMEDGENVIQAVERKERQEYKEQQGPDRREPENQPQPKKEGQETKGEDDNENVLLPQGAAFGNKADFGRLRAALRLCLLAGCMAGVCFLFLYYRKRTLTMRLHKMSETDCTLAVRQIAKQLNRTLKKKGYGRKDERNDREYQLMLEKKLPGYPWEQVFSIFQKAAFSPNGVTKEEYQTVYCLYRSLEKR
ncbi:transglutaminase-like domain-containing protein [Lachnospiraceae bacterium 45-W7]